jgi:hypothetical protein
MGGESKGGTAGANGGSGGGAVACEGPYVACGCGCCGSEPMEAACYYPDRGDDLATIVSEDEAERMSTSCAMAGCSLGMRFHCCPVPWGDLAPGTYEGTGYIGALDRIRITRTSPEDRCTELSLVDGGMNRDPVLVEPPDGWAVEATADYACEDRNSAAASSRRTAIGGLGTVSWADPSRCALSVDVTLFFLNADGGVDAVRLLAPAVPVPLFRSSGC